MPRALSRREGVLLSISVHLVARHPDPGRAATSRGSKPTRPSGSRSPRSCSSRSSSGSARAARFVFVQPRVDIQAPKPPPRAELSDIDRRARRAGARAEADQPAAVRARQHAERVESARSRAQPRGQQGPQQQPDNAADTGPRAARAIDAADVADRRCEPRATRVGAARRTDRRPASLGDALRNLQRYVAAGWLRQPAGRRRPGLRARDSVRHQGRRVRSVDSPLHRAGQAQLVHAVRGDVDAAGTS